MDSSIDGGDRRHRVEDHAEDGVGEAPGNERTGHMTPTPGPPRPHPNSGAPPARFTRSTSPDQDQARPVPSRPVPSQKAAARVRSRDTPRTCCQVERHTRAIFVKGRREGRIPSLCLLGLSYPDICTLHPACRREQKSFDGGTGGQRPNTKSGLDHRPSTLLPQAWEDL